MKVSAFSCLTNWAAGLSPEKLDHAEVIETGAAAAAAMMDLLEGWCS
jgi:purine-nucleoside phosphorylase